MFIRGDMASEISMVETIFKGTTVWDIYSFHEIDTFAAKVSCTRLFRIEERKGKWNKTFRSFRKKKKRERNEELKINGEK